MRQDSSNSYSTSTNIRFGAKEFPELWWNVNAIEIPTISMDVAKFNTRPGAMSGIAPDTCTFSELSVELTLDKNWKTYDELYNFFLEGLNVENAKFSHDKKFELWCEFVDGQGNIKKKFWFHSCRLMDFGGIVATPNDAEDSHQVITITFAILYYDHGDQIEKIIDLPRP